MNVLMCFQRQFYNLYSFLNTITTQSKCEDDCCRWIFPFETTLFFVFPSQVQYLTLMGMELHARTRRDLEPDPEFDPICALFYCLSSDAPLPEVDGTQLTGAIVVDKDHQSFDQG